MKYAIYNNTDYDFSDYGLDDIYFSNKIDPGGISTFSGDFSAFRNKGGKFLTYHGSRDEVSNSACSLFFSFYLTSNLS